MPNMYDHGGLPPLGTDSCPATSLPSRAALLSPPAPYSRTLPRVIITEPGLERGMLALLHQGVDLSGVRAAALVRVDLVPVHPERRHRFRQPLAGPYAVQRSEPDGRLGTWARVNSGARAGSSQDPLEIPQVGT